MLVALPADVLRFEAPQIIESGLTVLGSADGTRQELRQLMRLADGQRVRSISESVCFDEINTALDRVASGDLKSRLVVEFH